MLHLLYYSIPQFYRLNSPLFCVSEEFMCYVICTICVELLNYCPFILFIYFLN